MGILISCALAQLGWRVALIEQGILRGREQGGTFPQRARSFLELNLCGGTRASDRNQTTLPALVSWMAQKFGCRTFSISA